MNRIGVMLSNLSPDRLRAFELAAELDFRVVHTGALPESWLTGPERSAFVAAAKRSKLIIASMFVGFDGQSYGDLPAIARTVGLLAVPELREHRRHVALAYSDLAREVGAGSLSCHIGFLPPGTDHPDYVYLVDTMRAILDHCAVNGQTFHLETGQEPAEVMLRLLQDVDRPNLGLNFDPANFLLYDTDEPLSALERLAPFVWGVHCKDAIRPERPGLLGTEMPLGQGQVDFPRFVRQLQHQGYRGPLVIEREDRRNVISDVQMARTYLEDLLGGST